MPYGWYGLICAICFEPLALDTCFVDEHGDRWDLHPGACAAQAGQLVTEDPGPIGGHEHHGDDR